METAVSTAKIRMTDHADAPAPGCGTRTSLLTYPVRLVILGPQGRTHMPENFDIGSHVSRILILLFAIIAGSLIGSLFLGSAGLLIGAFVGFIIAIEKGRKSR